MEPRSKAFLMWTGIACLCFVGIPFHLKGNDREQLEMAFKNYSTLFNKSYSEDALNEKLPHFKVCSVWSDYIIIVFSIIVLQTLPMIID